MELSILAQKLRDSGATLYEQKSYSSAKRNAQINLDGRTHYADDATLRYFHARIVSCSESCSGSILMIIESVALDYQNTSRGFRYVAFDVFGSVVGQVSLEDAYRTKEHARKAYYKWVDSFDIVAHYRETLESMARRLENQADAYRAALQ